MNWTGGNLSRHSRNAKTSTTRAQKEFFARTRTGTLKSGRIPEFDGAIHAAVLLSNNGYQEAPGGMDESRRSPVTGPDEFYDQRRAFERESLVHFRKRKASTTSTAGRIPVKNTNDTFDAKPSAIDEMDVASTHALQRQWLLQKNDWTGLKMQKPPKLKYSPEQRSLNVGKRRAILDSHHPRYCAREISPFGRSQEGIDVSGVRRSRGGNAIQGVREEDHIHISIGGRANELHTSPVLGSRDLGQSHAHVSSSLRSDQMLLDEARGSQRAKYQQRSSPCSYSRVRTSSPLQNCKIGKRKRHTSSGSPLGHSTRPPLELRNLQDSSQARSSRAHPSPSHGRKQYRREVSSSSSISIHQPVPRSSRKPRVLSSNTSDELISTLAVIGDHKPAVPPWEVMENAIWKSWVVPLENSIISEPLLRGDAQEMQTSPRPSISPGVSMFRRLVFVPKEAKISVDPHAVSFLDEHTKRGPRSKGTQGMPSPAHLVKQHEKQLEDHPSRNIKPQDQVNVFWKTAKQLDEDLNATWAQFVLPSSDSHCLELHSAQLVSSSPSPPEDLHDATSSMLAIDSISPALYPSSSQQSLEASASRGSSLDAHGSNDLWQDELSTHAVKRPISEQSTSPAQEVLRPSEDRRCSSTRGNTSRDPPGNIANENPLKRNIRAPNPPAQQVIFTKPKRFTTSQSTPISSKINSDGEVGGAVSSVEYLTPLLPRLLPSNDKTHAAARSRTQRRESSRARRKKGMGGARNVLLGESDGESIEDD